MNRPSWLGLASFFLVILAAAACQPTQPQPTAVSPKPLPSPDRVGAEGPPAKVTPAPDWRAEWERTLAAARQEARLVLSGPTSAGARAAITAFQQAYPEIQLEYNGLSGSDFLSRVGTERSGGQYLWDLAVAGSDTAVTQLLPQGVLDPIKPNLIRPELLDDSKWLNGFDWGFMDTARERAFSPTAYVNWSIDVNWDVIHESELTGLQDLLEPRFKGKISWNDPRFEGGGSLHAGLFIQTLGEAGVRKLLTEQDIVLTRDLRQQVEWLVRGRYTIAVGISRTDLQHFQQEGLGLNVRPLDKPGAVLVTTGPSGCACVINKAPHPNAAKVFLDWYLSPEGQNSWNRNTVVNSRRLDVEPGDPTTMPTPSVEYLIFSREENQPLRQQAVRLARETLGS